MGFELFVWHPEDMGSYRSSISGLLLPLTNELVVIGGNSYPVTHVEHFVLEGVVNVHVTWGDGHDWKMLEEDLRNKPNWIRTE